MPIHYSAKKLNIQCVSSTLATQVPNAVGYAYSNKIKGIEAVSGWLLARNVMFGGACTW